MGKRVIHKCTAACGDSLPHLTSPYKGKALERRRAIRLSEEPVDSLAFLKSQKKRDGEKLSQGKTNGEIGEIVGVSPRTVQKHVERIFVKLGVENRSVATAMVHELMRRM